jgi:centromeric protein E
MVRLWIESTAVGQKGSARVSSLSLVDLAGSESVKLNGGERREEGHYINKSLMTLGQVVLSLSSDNKTGGHIPYRDSKLTRLLQPSLSGNAQMVLLCCIHPSESHMEESHNTFKFATRAKKVKQKAVINTAPDEKLLLQNYRDEIEDLRNQLAEAKEQQRLLQEQKAAVPSVVEPSTDGDGEVKELVEAIKTMERLILKSRPHNVGASTSWDTDDDVSDSDVDLLADDNDEKKEDDDDLLDDLLVDRPLHPRTPEKDQADDALTSELSRIRGLLGSVLQKRGLPTDPTELNNTSLTDSPIEKSLNFCTPARSPAEGKEVETLRKQLEQQEMATNLRKADSSFLQSQLREKDMLLEEVSKVLEAVEARQGDLEKENASLRAELNVLKAKHGVS